MPDRRVLDVSLANRQGAHHHLARVHPDPRLDGHRARRTQLRRVAPHLLLQAQRRVECPLRVILVRHRRAEQGEDAVASRLRYVAVVPVDGLHHQLQRRIDDGARVLGVELLQQLDRALDVREQRRDGLALAVRPFVRGDRCGDTDATCGTQARDPHVGGCLFTEDGTAAAAELLAGLVRRPTGGAAHHERGPAFRAKAARGAVVALA